jgi:hypothetical protein
MATYYWRGGAGTWDATTTTNWSTTSGGLGGAGPPTSADNVIFNNLSNATAYAVTVGTNANALDITIAGPAVGNVTITSGATAVINCYGSWLNAATGVVFTTTSGAAINFSATTTGKTVTTNSVTLGAMAVTFTNSSGGWTLGSAITTTGVFTVTSGAFNTSASNYAINAASYSSSGGTFKSITLNSSTVTTTATGGFQINPNATNLTFSGASSTIICSNGSPAFGGISGLTYGTVQFTSATLATVTITGSNTYTALTFTSRTSDGIGAIGFSGDQVVTGTLTVGAANTAVRRLWLRSSAVGTQRTFTVAVVATLADVDFRDIVAAGAAGTLSGTRLGNCRNNSNITFGAGTTKYWSTVNGASASWSGTAWATSSGGTAAVNNFPLAQDTCIIDNSGATTGDGLRTGNTVTIDASWNMGTLNFSGRTVAFNWTQANQDPILYGNVTLTSSMTMTTVSGSPTWTFAGAGLTQTVDSAGITLRLSQLFIDSLGGTVSLSRDTVVELIALTTGSFILTQGTLSLGSFTLTAVVFSSTNSNTRTLAFGTGNITLTGVNTTIFDTTTVTGMTITGTPVVNCTATTGTSVQTRTFIVGNHGEAQAISVNINPGTSAVDIFRLATNSGAFKDVTFSSTFTGTIQISNTIIFYGNVTFGGATAYTGNSTLTFAATSGTKTIRTSSLTIDAAITFNGLGGAWAMQDALTLGATRALTFTNGTLQLKAGTTSTVGSFVTTGTTLKYLQSTTPGTQATISDASGTDAVTYLSIQDSNATGGAVWDATAPTNVYVTNNTGWNFGTLAALSGVVATGAVGSLTFSFNLAVTGVQATGSVGSFGFANAYTLSGVQATGAVGNVYTGWYVIPTNQTPAWTGVSTTQTPSWTSVSTTQTPSWTNIIQS